MLFDKSEKEKCDRVSRFFDKTQEDEILVMHNRKPIVQQTAIENKDMLKSVGVAKGKFTVPDDFDDADSCIANLFSGGVGCENNRIIKVWIIKVFEGFPKYLRGRLECLPLL